MIRIYIYKTAFFFIIFFSFLLWYSCFTTLHLFLLDIEVKQLHRYMHPLFSGFPPHLGLRRAQVELPVLCGRVSISSGQLLSRVRLFAMPWTAARQATLSITSSWSLLKLMSVALVMPSNHLISVIPFSSRLQSFPASGSFPMSWFFTSGGQSVEVSASASVLPMNIQDWFPLGWTGLDLLAVQGTLKSLLQHHHSKASILWSSAFFMVQLSHPYMTTGKTVALTRWTFVGKVMSAFLICWLGWS